MSQRQGLHRHRCHVGGGGVPRQGDASTLTWKQVDVLKKTITCPPEKRRMKSKKPPHVEPIHNQLLVWLRAWYAEHNQPEPTRPVFPTLSKKSIHRRNGLSNTFSQFIETGKNSQSDCARKRRGIAWPLDRGSLISLSAAHIQYAA